MEWLVWIHICWILHAFPTTMFMSAYELHRDKSLFWSRQIHEVGGWGLEVIYNIWNGFWLGPLYPYLSIFHVNYGHVYDRLFNRNLIHIFPSKNGKPCLCWSVQELGAGLKEFLEENPKDELLLDFLQRFRKFKEFARPLVARSRNTTKREIQILLGKVR